MLVTCNASISKSGNRFDYRIPHQNMSMLAVCHACYMPCLYFKVSQQIWLYFCYIPVKTLHIETINICSNMFNVRNAWTIVCSCSVVRTLRIWRILYSWSHAFLHISLSCSFIFICLSNTVPMFCTLLTRLVLWSTLMHWVLTDAVDNPSHQGSYQCVV